MKTNRMKFVASLLVLAASGAVSAETFKPGAPQSRIQIIAENRSEGIPDLKFTPLMSLNELPDLGISEAITASPEFIRALSATVPENEELFKHLRLSRADFESAIAAGKVEFGYDFTPVRQELNKDQRQAWETLLRQRKHPLSVTFALETSYMPLDFEVITYTGENDDRRATCVAGFRQKLVLTIVAVSAAGDRTFENQIQGIRGTKYSNIHGSFYSYAKTFLESKIDLTREAYERFARECKAQRGQ